MKTRYLLVGALSIATITSCRKDLNSERGLPSDLSTSQQVNNGGQEIAADNYVPNELIVKFKAGTIQSKKDIALSRINGNAKEHVVTASMKRAGDQEGFFVLHTPNSVMEAVATMKNLAEVEYAEPNWIYTLGGYTSNDSYYTDGSLWGMHGDGIVPFSNQFGSQADEAWAVGHTGSSTVYVGIIDEGSMWSHDDLAGNFGNPKEIAGNSTDDDRNGYTDDAYGWDFVNNDNTTFDGAEDDHGTHVAGTIGAVGGNGKGVAGVNWAVKMISAKFLGPNGGSLSNAVKAVDYLTDLKNKSGLNLVATNNSWGGGGYSQALYDAISRANTAKILFIAAAGNGNMGGKGINIDKQPSYPASYKLPNVIAVAAIDKNGNLASFSNYGAQTVLLGAPGVGIVSTLPGNTYGSYSGTSMATPHVTGGAALYASTHAGATASQIKEAIQSSATSTTSLSSKTITGGRLNVSGF